MVAKEYPVGTKIRFEPIMGIALPDKGKIGRVVGVTSGGRPLIFLHESTHESDHSTKELFVTWHTVWRQLVPLIKGEQLLFDFMRAGG